MAPKLDFDNSLANNLGSGGAFSIKTTKENGFMNHKNAPLSERIDSVSPSNEAPGKKMFGQVGHPNPYNSRSIPKASKESHLDARTSKLKRSNSGGATLGAKESDEEIVGHGSESGAASRRSGRSDASARSRGSYGSRGSEGSRDTGSSRSRRPENNAGRAARPPIPLTRSNPPRLTRSALTSLHRDGDRRVLHGDTIQLGRSKAIKAEKNQEKQKQKEKKKVKDEIWIDVDYQRGLFVRRGLYRDGTKPWQQRFGKFGDPQEDLLDLANLRDFYERVKRSLWKGF